MIRLLLLTTETLHHAYFARAMSNADTEVLALSETTRSQPPYATAHPFEVDRDLWEAELWFGGKEVELTDFVQTEKFPDVNDPEAVSRVKRFAPDLVVTFGTGKLRAEMIGACSDRLLNLHGGDPEGYRGLDTHMWAIWHRDFGALSTCLHRVSEEFDKGDIVDTMAIPISRGMELHQLRQRNTEVCVELVRNALLQTMEKGNIQSRPQRAIGRYYSYMPAVLKEVCVHRFRNFSSSLS